METQTGTKQGILFVGRLHGQFRYVPLHPMWHDNGLSDTEKLKFVQDSAVYLYKSGLEVMKVKLRLVQWRRKQDGQVLSFVTNVWKVSVEVIVGIYRQRWDVNLVYKA